MRGQKKASLLISCEDRKKHRYWQGVAKCFETRGESATAWPLEGRVQRALRDRDQQMLLHCCPHMER